MKMKKLVAVLSCTMLIGMTMSTAFGANYQLCNVANCTKTKVHSHNGVNYCGHYSGDGHSHHSGGGHHSGGHHR